MILTARPPDWDTVVPLPPGVGELLTALVQDGFVRCCCGHLADPDLLLAYYEWPDFLDLVTIRTFERITAARVPRPAGGRVDVFDPQRVVWAYEGPAEPTLRALLTLVHPAHPSAPTSAVAAPPALRVPREDQRPVRIRMPEPERRNARATRLGQQLIAGM
ncbi:MAG: hypothetical protein ACRDQJ_18895 [Pseudonocardiaceae bacterium]